jgi:hypothetical protein
MSVAASRSLLLRGSRIEATLFSSALIETGEACLATRSLEGPSSVPLLSCVSEVSGEPSGEKIHAFGVLYPSHLIRAFSQTRHVGLRSSHLMRLFLHDLYAGC